MTRCLAIILLVFTIHLVTSCTYTARQVEVTMDPMPFWNAVSHYDK